VLCLLQGGAKAHQAPEVADWQRWTESHFFDSVSAPIPKSFSAHPLFPCKQARIQVLRFGGNNTFLGGKYFCFIVCLKQIILLIFSD